MVEVDADGSETPESARESSIADDDLMAASRCFHFVGGKPQPMAGALDVRCGQRGFDHRVGVPDRNRWVVGADPIGGQPVHSQKIVAVSTLYYDVPCKRVRGHWSSHYLSGVEAFMG